MIIKTRGVMLYEILKKIKYPEKYYKKGTGSLNYNQVMAIYKWVMEK